MCLFKILHRSGIFVNVFSGYNTKVPSNIKGVKISHTLTSNEIFVSDKHMSFDENLFLNSLLKQYKKFKRLECFSITPFGFPVEPEVYITYAKSSKLILVFKLSWLKLFKFIVFILLEFLKLFS